MNWTIWLWRAQFEVREPRFEIRIPSGLPPSAICIVTREGRWRFWQDCRPRPGQRLIAGPERMAYFRLAGREGEREQSPLS